MAFQPSEQETLLLFKWLPNEPRGVLWQMMQGKTGMLQQMWQSKEARVHIYQTAT